MSFCWWVRSAGVVPCKQALYHDLVDVVSVVAKQSWDKSLMIGYDLEQFANFLANLEQELYILIIWWTKMGHCQWFSMGCFYSIVNTCASKWTRNGKFKLKLVRPEKN